MLPSYFNFVFVNLRQKAHLRLEFSPKFCQMEKMNSIIYFVSKWRKIFSNLDRFNRQVEVFRLGYYPWPSYRKSGAKRRCKTSEINAD